MLIKMKLKHDVKGKCYSCNLNMYPNVHGFGGL